MEAASAKVDGLYAEWETLEADLALGHSAST